MRMSRVGTYSAWVFTLLGCLWSAGCKRSPPVPEATVLDAGAPSADAGRADAGLAANAPTPLLFQDVKISRVDQEVTLTYTLVNQGGRRVRATGCLWLHDQDGVFIERYSLKPLSLRGGESDVFEDVTRIPESLWKQTRSVQLFAAESCTPSTVYPPFGPRAHLDVKGHPLPPETPAPRMRGEPEEGVALFAISDVRLSQDSPSSPVVLHVQVKNISPSRAAGSVCTRLYDEKDSEASIDEDSTDDFNLAAGDLVSLKDELTLDEDTHWESTVSLKVYAARFGCSDKVKEARSNVVALDKPEGIHAPREEEEETGMDESDAYDPAEEFPDHPVDAVTAEDAGT